MLRTDVDIKKDNIWTSHKKIPLICTEGRSAVW